MENQDNQDNLRGLLEGSIVGSIWTIILFASLYTPIAIVGFLLLPMPFTVLTYRRGLRIATMAAFVAVLLSVLLNLFAIGFSLILYSIALGIVSGHSFRTKKNVGATFVAMVLAVLGSNLITLLMIGFVTDYNIFTDIVFTIRESISTSESILSTLGLTGNLNETNVEELINMFRMLLPTLLIAGSVLVAYAYYQSVSLLFRKLGEADAIEKLPKVEEIRLPKKILWYYIFTTLGMIISTLAGNMESFIYILLLNIVQILSLALAVQGIGLVWYHMKQRKWSGWIRVPIVLILLQPFLLQIMTWVGMFDLFFNWRKLPK